MVHVARDDDRAVLRAVPAVEERLAVVVLVRHVLDVGQEADRRVLVGVRRVRLVLHRLVEDQERRRGALVVLAQDGPRLLLEGRLVVLEVPEAVGLDLDDRRQRRGRDGHVVAGPVVGREGVGVGAERLQDVVVLRLRVALRPAEHHVLEEVGEAREPWLHLVARAGADHRVVGDDPRRVERDREHGQAVVERRPADREREDLLVLASRARRGPHAQHEHRQGPGQSKSRHCIPLRKRLSPPGPRAGRGPPGLTKPYMTSGATDSARAERARTDLARRLAIGNRARISATGRSARARRCRSGP